MTMPVYNGSTLQIVSFSVGSKYYAVEIERVIEIVYFMEPNPFPEAPSYIKGVIDLRGSIIPVLHLEAYLGMAGDSPKGYILVVRIGAQTLGILVDEVYDVMHVAQDSVQDSDSVLESDQARHIKAVIRSSDRLLMLLDMDKFSGSLPKTAGDHMKRLSS
jgi:purine-binding chemotaxis protein CheW